MISHFANQTETFCGKANTWLNCIFEVWGVDLGALVAFLNAAT
jgi:hypothetical protein